MMGTKFASKSRLNIVAVVRLIRQASMKGVTSRLVGEQACPPARPVH